ncbi:alkaline phosphatase family protein [Halalkalibacter urbisdiaboli]|uniref:alkaline phosphatase family protein n=1 Tax=Halalkalibacter urbisdiaboli TaxID=1960589 RepID=UPI000B43C7BE|nr:alkaline phosphatase family protein [Halalkalibacter urbisdiaboli]
MKKWTLLFCFCIILIGCQDTQPEGASLQGENASKLREDQKKVIAIMVDSMTYDLLEMADKEGKIPALSYLMERGQVHKEFIAPFPTLSVVIESTLITGAEPDVHNVPGLVWYNQDENRLINYGSTTMGMWKLGFKQVLYDSLYHLNNTHLSKNTETIFESLQRHGFSTGSINTLVYRGQTEHELTLPVPFNKILSEQIPIKTHGPDLLSFGKVIQPKVVQENESKHDAIYQKFGLNDQHSTEVVKKLIEKQQQPDFTFIFFPNFDKEAHYHGPDNVEDFAEADYYLQEILNSYDSWDKALEENIFIVFGDHGQDAIVHDKGKAAIELEPLLEPYSIAPLLDDPASADFIVANNHRMVYLYRGLTEIAWKDIQSSILQDERVDHVAYLEGEELVIHHNDEILRVKKDGGWKDEFDQSWELSGDPHLVDVTINHDEQTISYGDYPDAFNQLYHALHSHSDSMIITAKPGYVMKTEASPVHHDGGEHGGFHKNDTEAALIIAGTDKEPNDKRMTEFKPYILSLFGIED